MDVANDRAEERLLARIRRFEDERHIFTEMNRLIGQPWPLREILGRIAAVADGLLTIAGACSLDRNYIACVNANRTMPLETIMGLPGDEVFRTGQRPRRQLYRVLHARARLDLAPIRAGASA
jgi:hypothetical protein